MTNIIYKALVDIMVQCQESVCGAYCDLYDKEKECCIFKLINSPADLEKFLFE